MLSALTHGAHPEREKVLHALQAALPEAARHHLEALMTITHEYQSDFARRYFAEGRAEGEARGKAEGEVKALLAVLAARGITVPNGEYDRITECTDPDQLETWIRRAATAEKIHDLFD